MKIILLVVLVALAVVAGLLIARSAKTPGPEQAAGEGEAAYAAADAEEDVVREWLDITTVYTTPEGEPFAFVLLDERQGIAHKNGSYRIALPTETTPTLDAATFSAIKAACDKGEALLAQGDKAGAKAAFEYFAEAYALIPQPREQWHATGWVMSRMGESYIRTGSFELAAKLYPDLMWCPGTIGNPWIHLRAGQVKFENGDLDRAADELLRAYMGADKAIFALEDPKYYQFLSTRARGL